MSRKTLLTAVLRHARLVTPSPIALRVVNVASRPDCTIAEIAGLLSQDPILCGKVLKTVNSCVFAATREPIATVERAVMMLGLNPLRSLVLGLSLPIAQSKTQTNSLTRDFWVDAVSGGILAKELSIHREGMSPGYDLVAGLLRDLGLLLLAQHDPAGWEKYHRTPTHEALTNPCAVEDRIFGINHVEVTVALLTSWNLPNDVLEPVRCHHAPERLASAQKSWRHRAELLNFIESLVRLDQVAESPDLLKALLGRAMELFGFGQESLINFLQGVAPKIEEIKSIFELGLCDSHDYSHILRRGCEALVDLSFRSQFDPADRVAPTAVGARQKFSETVDYGGVPVVATATMAGAPPEGPPAFEQGFLTHLPPDGCQLDQFEIREELGRGAMGVVFRAFDPAVHRDVAIKVMSPQYASSREARQRFTREARSLAALQHPNVVSVYTVGMANGLPYIAMEYVSGSSLEDWVNATKPLPVAQIVRFGRQLAQGLAAAHQKGIIHRDMKPANIFIEAQTEQIKIGDFGLARGIDNLGLTQAGALVGSPLYMSPEQIDGHLVDPRSDLFSLGSVFYFMCTARLPFEANTLAAVLRLIGEARPLPPRAFRPDLPEWLNALVLDLLKQKPQDRIASAEALDARLQAGG